MLVLEGHTEPITCLVFSPDGKMLLSGGEDGTLKCWGLEEAAERWEESLPTRPIRQIAFREGGRLVVSGGSEVTGLEGWGGDQIRPVGLQVPTGFEPLAVSADGKLQAITDRAGNVQLRDTWVGRPLRTLETNLAPLEVGAFNADGSRVALGSAAGTVRCWLTVPGQALATWRFPQARLQRLAFTPDGLALAVAGGRAASWADLTTGKSQTLIAAHSEAIFYHCVAFAPDGRTLAVGHWDGRIYLWELPGPVPRGCYRFHAGAVHAVAFAPDGLTAASGGDDYVIRIWDVDAG